MKEKLVVFTFVLFSALVSFGQATPNVNVEAMSSEKKGPKLLVKTEVSSQQLTYSPEMPAANSYSIVYNANNVALTSEQLLKMNFYRKYDIAVEWKISDDLVVLLLPFNK